MKAQVLSENLLRALTRLGRIVPQRSQVVILQNIKLTTKKDGFYFTATNTETTETVWVGGKVEKEGSLCVPAKLFIEFASSLPSGTVEIEKREEALHISCSGFSATIPTTPAEEFPETPQVDREKAIKINKKDFYNALTHVLFSAASDEGRPVLTGVKIRKIEEKTQLVATDGYRLSVKSIDTEIPSINGSIVPSRALGEVMKIAQEEKEEENISISTVGDSQVGFLIGDTTIITRLIEGEYPNFERIIPKLYTTRVQIDKEGFLKAVKSAAIFARDNANIIKLVIKNEKVTVMANAPQVGENNVEVEAVIEGDGGEIAFNSRFLVEFLSNLSSDSLIFEMTGALNPGVFKPAGDDSMFHIIMPVRVQS